MCSDSPSHRYNISNPEGYGVALDYGTTNLSHDETEGGGLRETIERGSAGDAL